MGNVPQVPLVSQVPQVPQAPLVPQVPQAPQVPQVRQVPQVPQVSQVPTGPTDRTGRSTGPTGDGDHDDDDEKDHDDDDNDDDDDAKRRRGIARKPRASAKLPIPVKKVYNKIGKGMEVETLWKLKATQDTPTPPTSHFICSKLIFGVCGLTTAVVCLCPGEAPGNLRIRKNETAEGRATTSS